MLIFRDGGRGWVDVFVVEVVLLAMMMMAGLATTMTERGMAGGFGMDVVVTVVSFC